MTHNRNALLSEADLLEPTSDEDLSSNSENEYFPESESENSSSENLSAEEEPNFVGEICESHLVSKDKTIWSPTPISTAGRASSENIITMKPGVTRYASARVGNEIDAFLLFFPSSIKNIVIENSNKYGRDNFGVNHIELDRKLLHAYLGVLILSGVYKSKNEQVLDLFHEDIGRPIFRSVMSRKTFLYVTKILRFDDSANRRRNRLTSYDKYAPIRNLWDKWVDLLPKFYNPQPCVTIDDQLLGFHGRCSFRQYMPNKPEKYGLKFWMLTCADTSYVWNIQPYLGRVAGAASERNQGERVVMDLIGGLKGHNITMNNFFSSYEVDQKLLDKKLTMVVTLR